MTLPKDNDSSELEEIFDLQSGHYRFNPDDLCDNGKIRCMTFDNDSDSNTFDCQCNGRNGHLGDHYFGICGMLSESFSDDIKWCTSDDHNECNCSVCWVREIRDGIFF